jgi:hypothetical protein
MNQLVERITPEELERVRESNAKIAAAESVPII